MLGKHMRCLALTFLQLLRDVSPSEGSLPSESWVLEEQAPMRMDGVIRLSGRKMEPRSTT
jgi:hypothetical protein